MSRLMNGISLLMLLQWRCLGNETKAYALHASAPCPPSFGHKFFSQCGQTPKKSRSLFIEIVHLPVSFLELYFSWKINRVYAHPLRGLACFIFFPGHNHQPCRWRDIKAVWHMLSVPGNLLALRQNDLLLGGKINRATKDHSQLWIRNAAFTIKKVLVSGLFHASLFYLHISYESAMFISHILEM